MSGDVRGHRIGDNEDVLDDHEERLTALEKFQQRAIGAIGALSLMLGAWGFFEFVLGTL
jgi:hypothetical protein